MPFPPQPRRVDIVTKMESNKQFLCFTRSEDRCMESFVFHSKKNVMEKLKICGRARVLFDQSAFKSFCFRISCRYQPCGGLPMFRQMPHWTRPAKKAIMTKEKNSRRTGNFGAGSGKTKGKDKEKQNRRKRLPGARYFCAVKEKRKAESFR